jgi:parallel beta-helix repeat protein
MLFGNILSDWVRAQLSPLRAIPLSRSRRRRSRRPAIAAVETLESRRLLSAEHFVANAGDDWGTGAIDSPFRTIRRALDASAPGDTITLRNGVYEGGFTIDVDQLTIRSAPGEWGVIESPLTLQTDGHENSVIRYSYDVQGGRLQDVEIVGGYYYGVMFWDWWDSSFEAGSVHQGASGITLDGVKVHDTGVDAIKITSGADDITIQNAEIFRTGRRTTESADGIDNNNGDRMVVRNNHIHDTAGIGILTSGGTRDSIVEGNFITRTGGAGITNGYYSELEWLDPFENPWHYASLNTIVRNNLVVDAAHAGVGIYGALNGQVSNNTLVNAGGKAQAPLQFGGYDMWVSNTAPSFQHIASSHVSVVNNLIVTAADNTTRMVDLREASVTGGLILDHNLYWGGSLRGTLFIDRNLTGEGTAEQTFAQWQATSGYDQHSLVADPRLDAHWHLPADSPARDRGITLPGLTGDFDGNVRTDGAPDLGADEAGAGPHRAVPPIAFGAPTLEFTQATPHAWEGQTILLRVVRQGTTLPALTVDYATQPITAQAQADFLPIQGTLVFAPGETEKQIAVSLPTDGLAEGDEHFRLTLSNPTTTGNLPVRLGHIAATTVTVDDLDTPATLHYATRWVSELGNDVTGDGSEAHPWKSLQKAADSVVAGDYVMVAPGSYDGFQVTTSGKPDARITFHAGPGVIIDAPNPVNRLDGINLEGASFVTIEGFQVSNMPRAGLRSVSNDGCILRQNVSQSNGYWGILTGWSENIVIEGNTTSGSVREHGIYVSNSADGAVVRNNIVSGNRGSGIQFNADASLPGDGIHSHNLIEGNILSGNGAGGGAALNFDGLQESVVRNNLLYDNHATGIVLYQGRAAAGSRNNLIENNTVVMAADSRWALLMTDGSDGNTVVNNILLTRNPQRGSITIESDSLPRLSDHNVLQGLFELDGVPQGFGAYQAFTQGADSHSIVIPQGQVTAAIDLLFVNPAAGDFRLKPGSLARDAGSPVFQPGVDLFQHPRGLDLGIDIGALEAGVSRPAVHFEAPQLIGYEGIGIAEVALVRTGDTSQALTVQVTNEGGTADTTDFTPVQQTITFLPLQTRATFPMFVRDDTTLEERETVVLTLQVQGDPSQLANTTDQATMNLISDDAWNPGTLEFLTPVVTVEETAGVARLTVVRTSGVNGDVSVHYQTTAFVRPRDATWIKRHTELLYPNDPDQPATAPLDYTTTQGTLTFAAGETMKVIEIPLLDDTEYETSEAFLVTLDSPTPGARLGQAATARVRIESDDARQPGTFVFDTATCTVSEGAGQVAVTIRRINGGNVPASVRLYDTGAGNGVTTDSAWAGKEYDFLPNQIHFAAGELSRTITIRLANDSVAEVDKVFSIQLYDPTNDATIGNPAVTRVTIVDDDSAFYFKAPGGGSAYTVGEAAGSLPVEVVRIGSLAAPASVRITTVDYASAKPGIDFKPVDVVLQFAPGQGNQKVPVPIVNDLLMEPDETFGVAMSNAVGAQQGSWTWTATIKDNDYAAKPGQFELSAATFQVLENAGGLVVTVRRVGGSDGTVTVQYGTSDGAAGVAASQSAWAGSQYTATSGTLTFSPGQTSKTFRVPIRNNTTVNPDRYFTLQIHSPEGGATLGSITRSTVQIVEDDSAIEFAQSGVTAGEGSGVVKIRVVRLGNLGTQASVDITLKGGTATAGLDYEVPLKKTLVFAPGVSVIEFEINLLNDTLREPEEWFGLSLGNVVGARLGSLLTGTVRITDND